MFFLKKENGSRSLNNLQQYTTLPTQLHQLNPTVLPLWSRWVTIRSFLQSD